MRQEQVSENMGSRLLSQGQIQSSSFLTAPWGIFAMSAEIHGRRDLVGMLPEAMERGRGCGQPSRKAPGSPYKQRIICF